MHRLFFLAFVSALLVTSADAQQPRGPGGGRFGGFGGTSIMAIEEVQKELGLNDSQKQQIKELAESIQKQMQGSFNRQDFQNLSEDARQKLREDARQKGADLQKQALEQLGKILDAKQLERFQQLRLQRDGISSITDAAVADKLGLTPEQRSQAAKLIADVRTATFGGGRRGGGQSTDEERRQAFEKMRADREKLTADLTALLNDQQKAQWATLQGAKFEFPRPNFGGPGGRRGN